MKQNQYKPIKWTKIKPSKVVLNQATPNEISRTPNETSWNWVQWNEAKINLHNKKVIHNAIKWNQNVIIKWSHVETSRMKWHKVWTRAGSIELNWNKMTSNEVKQNQVRPSSGISWNQMKSNEHKSWHQVNPRGNPPPPTSHPTFVGHIYIYIYMYIHIERKRERERERDVYMDA